MLYRPPDRGLWDTTLVRRGEWFHLFHLRGGESLGHARSRDLVRWETRSDIDLRGPAGAWNEKGGPWTGCVVAHDGRFYLFAGGLMPNGIAGYGLFVSDDLEAWRQFSDEAVLCPEPPHYRRAPSGVHFMHAAWRDPCILRDAEGWYHAFLCARSPESSADDVGTLVAHARSRDLQSWEHLPPIARLPRIVFAEVPDVFRMGDWWYLLILDHGWGGTRLDSAARKDQAGTFYLRSRSMEGPYEWPEEPLLIGCSHDMVGPWAARTIAVGEERWLYFHHNGRRKAFGLPKRVDQQADGTLQLRHLPLLEPLFEAVVVHKDRPAGRVKPWDAGRWSRDAGGWEGRAEATGTACILADELTDGEVLCSITSHGAARAGVVVRAAGEHGTHMFEQKSAGLGLWLDFEFGRVLLQSVAWVPGFGWGRHVFEQMGQDRLPHTLQELCTPLEKDRKYRLRVLMRDEYLEVYLDDQWVMSASACPIRGGRVELVLERGAARFEELSVRSLPPLEPGATGA